MTDIFGGIAIKKLNVGQLNTHVKEIYAAIRDKIRDAHSKNQTSIKFELPEVFNVSNISQSDARIYIYSEVLKKLEQCAELKISLTVKGLEHTINISWTPFIDGTDRKERINLISKYMIKSGDQND